MKRKFVDGALVADSTLGPRQVKVIANSGREDRAGDVLLARGVKLDAYSKNPVVLFGHNPQRPVGTARAYVAGDRVEAVITFAPAGASKDADEVCALAKSGTLSAVSVGFRPIKYEPIAGAGLRYTQWELMELSVVAVPCDADALVIQRNYRRSGRVLSGANREALAAVMHELDKAAACHADASGMLEKAETHRARAAREGQRIGDAPDDIGAQAMIARLMAELDKAGNAHADAVDLLAKSEGHRSSAARHAQRIAASADDSDDVAVDPDDDPDADVELSAAARRKRQIEIAERAV